MGITSTSSSVNFSLYARLAFVLVAAAFLTSVPDLAFATDDTLGKILCSIVTTLKSGTFKALATIAIIVLGIGALMGKISWGMAIMVILGIVLIFGAAEIVSTTIGKDDSGTDIGGCDEI